MPPFTPPHSAAESGIGLTSTLFIDFALTAGNCDADTITMAWLSLRQVWDTGIDGAGTQHRVWGPDVAPCHCDGACRDDHELGIDDFRMSMLLLVAASIGSSSRSMLSTQDAATTVLPLGCCPLMVLPDQRPTTSDFLLLVAWLLLSTLLDASIGSHDQPHTHDGASVSVGLIPPRLVLGCIFL